MRRGLLVVVAAFPLLLLSCEQTPTELVADTDGLAPQAVGIEGAAATEFVQVKLRCGHGVNGGIWYQLFDETATSELIWHNCAEGTWTHHAVGRTPTSVNLRFAFPGYPECDQTSYANYLLPETVKCPGTGRGVATATFRYVRF